MPQADAAAHSTPGRTELGPTKHPKSLPIALLWSTTSAPDTEGCGPQYASVVGYGIECVVCPRHAALASAAALGGVAARSPRGVKPTGLHLGRQPGAHPRQSGVPQPLYPCFPPKVDLHLSHAHARETISGSDASLWPGLYSSVLSISMLSKRLSMTDVRYGCQLLSGCSHKTLIPFKSLLPGVNYCKCFLYGEQ